MMEPFDVRLIAGTLPSFEAELSSDPAALARVLDVAPPAEWPPVGGEHDADAVAFFRDALIAQPTAAGWLAYYVCFGPELVGSAGFMGPPQDGVTEIGYSICRAHRGRGLATRAVHLLCGLGRREGARQLLAHVRPDNAASIIVLERNGFVPIESDRDGYLRFGREL